MHFVAAFECVRVVKNLFRFVKADAMFVNVACRFVLVPLEVHGLETRLNTSLSGRASHNYNAQPSLASEIRQSSSGGTSILERHDLAPADQLDSLVEQVREMSNVSRLEEFSHLRMANLK